MGYIKYIRSMAGNNTVIAVGASVILENDKGEILLQKRKDNGCWGYAGGTVEIDEVVENAARRELLEETGLTAKSLKLFNVFSGPSLHHKYPNGDELSIIDIVYICTDYEGDLHPQLSEVEYLKFFNILNLPSKITPPAIPIIKEYVRYRTQK